MLFVFPAVVSADVNAVTPSTNDINRTNGWAHVNVIDDTIPGEVTLEFVQPRAFFSCFEYRTDGDTSQKTSDTNYNGDITDGLYPYKCLSSIGTFAKTLTANEYVEVRMVFGGETDERFDWTRFDVIPIPEPEKEPTAVTPVVEKVPVRTHDMTCYQIYVNKDNNFEFIFFWQYKDNNWISIYNSEGNLVYRESFPYKNPVVIVELPDGIYTVKTFHEEGKILQEFVIGK